MCGIGKFGLLASKDPPAPSTRALLFQNRDSRTKLLGKPFAQQRTNTQFRYLEAVTLIIARALNHNSSACRLWLAYIIISEFSSMSRRGASLHSLLSDLTAKL